MIRRDKSAKLDKYCQSSYDISAFLKGLKSMSKASQKDSIKEYNRDEIIKTVKEAALTSYGVSSILTVAHKKGREEDAIYVHMDKDGTFSLDIHVIIAQGVKVTEIIRSLQKSIRFYMNHLYPKACNKINIYAEWISSNN